MIRRLARYLQLLLIAAGVTLLHILASGWYWIRLFGWKTALRAAITGFLVFPVTNIFWFVAVAKWWNPLYLLFPPFHVQIIWAMFLWGTTLTTVYFVYVRRIASYRKTLWATAA